LLLYGVNVQVIYLYNKIYLLLFYLYFNFIILYYICMMKEGKKVLSIQTDQTIIDKLKEICEKEKRSQAKTLEILIEDKHKLIKDGK
jgi:hypothetical protein